MIEWIGNCSTWQHRASTSDQIKLSADTLAASSVSTTRFYQTSAQPAPSCAFDESREKGDISRNDFESRHGGINLRNCCGFRVLLGAHLWQPILSTTAPICNSLSRPTDSVDPAERAECLWTRTTILVRRIELSHARSLACVGHASFGRLSATHLRPIKCLILCWLSKDHQLAQ